MIIEKYNWFNKNQPFNRRIDFIPVLTMAITSNTWGFYVGWLLWGLYVQIKDTPTKEKGE